MPKRKTLPKNFAEIAKRGDLEEIKNVFKKCEINAHKPYDKDTALYFTELHTDEKTFDLIAQEVVKWVLNNPNPLPVEDTTYRR